MKKIKLTRWAFITMLTAITAFGACKKSDEMSPAEKTEIELTTAGSESDAEADVLYDDVFDNVMGVNDDVGLGGSIGVYGRSSGTNTSGRFEGTDSARCFTVTITPITPGVFPKKVVVDFGTGCKGRDGHVRKGKVITHYSGRMVVPGSKAVTTFEDYYTDSTKVEGTHIIENKSTSNNRVFLVRVENGKFTRPNGNYIAWSGNRTRTQIEGNGTPNFSNDDIFSVTGEAVGALKLNNNIIEWTSAIVEPVIRKFTCRWAVKGQVKIKRNTRTSLLDYGNGTCDDQATLTINGNVHNITLR